MFLKMYYVSVYNKLCSVGIVNILCTLCILTSYVIVNLDMDL